MLRTIGPTIRPLLPGAALAAGIGVVAAIVGARIPIVGGPVTGVLLGLAITVTLRPLRRYEVLTPGVKFAGSRILQAAVVLLGAKVSLAQVLTVGWRSAPVMLGTLAACLLAAWGLGRWLGVEGQLTTLIGVGTAICGASAIAAITPVLQPAATKVAYALSTVFVFNIAAVVLFPGLGHALGMSEEAFGVFAGTAVNDTSSVVAAATTFGPTATDVAVVVKLARTLIIIPIAIGLALLMARADAAPDEGPRARLPVGRLVPWFLVGFLLLTLANPVLPAPAIDAAGTLAVLLITIALSAIGLSTDVGAIARSGVKPLILGGLLWLVVSGTSLAIQGLAPGVSVG